MRNTKEDRLFMTTNDAVQFARTALNCTGKELHTLPAIFSRYGIYAPNTTAEKTPDYQRKISQYWQDTKRIKETMRSRCTVTDIAILPIAFFQALCTEEERYKLRLEMGTIATVSFVKEYFTSKIDGEILAITKRSHPLQATLWELTRPSRLYISMLMVAMVVLGIMHLSWAIWPGAILITNFIVSRCTKPKRTRATLIEALDEVKSKLPQILFPDRTNRNPRNKEECKVTLHLSSIINHDSAEMVSKMSKDLQIPLFVAISPGDIAFEENILQVVYGVKSETPLHRRSTRSSFYFVQEGSAVAILNPGDFIVTSNALQQALEDGLL